MTSMMGILLPIVASTFPVILIDEPEAFLHPPQAYILGETLARLARDRSLQVFIATHDRSLLAGLTRDPSSSVTILRMSREGDVTKVRELTPESVRRISEDPSLRHTTVLEGLFSKLVVLCENERDCQFYASAVEELIVSADSNDYSVNDILFVSCGGKQAMPRFAGLLAESGVPIVATIDIDGLRDANDLRRLVEAMGKSWPESLDTDIARATSNLRAQPQPRKNKEVLKMISLVLEAQPEAWYGGDDKKRVRDQLQVPNGWTQAQKFGIATMDSDIDARDRALDSLDDLGVVIVKVGVLERFGPDLTQDKAKFVSAALASGVHMTDAARDHATRLLQAGGVSV